VQPKVQAQRLSGKLCLGRVQLQLQPQQIAVANAHGHQCCAGQHEGQQKSQIELEIDAGHQQHQQGERQHPAGAGGQQVEVAAADRMAAGARQMGQPPLAHALAQPLKRAVAGLP